MGKRRLNEVKREINNSDFASNYLSGSSGSLPCHFGGGLCSNSTNGARNCVKGVMRDGSDAVFCSRVPSEFRVLTSEGVPEDFDSE